MWVCIKTSLAISFENCIESSVECDNTNDATQRFSGSQSFIQVETHQWVAIAILRNVSSTSLIHVFYIFIFKICELK